jgi:hypothetical protein
MSRALQKMESSSTPPSQSSEQLKKIDETLRVLIDTLRNQSERLTVIEKAQSDLTRSLSSKPSTSETSELDSLRSGVNEIVKTLNAHSATLSALAETVSDKRVVKQSDGSEVSASELEAFSIMKTLEASQRTMTTALDELAAQVKAKSHVTLNEEKVAAVMSCRVDEHFQKDVQEPVEGLRSDLQGFRDEMGALGSDKLTEVRTAVEETLSELSEARRSIEAIERRVTFVGISRLALAVLPLFASLLLVGGLVWGIGSMFGIGPLFGWAWASFAAASAWWTKLLIAVATLGGAALFIWMVLRVSQWVYEELR